MVILGGLELLAAGYLIKQHLKHREEKQRLENEALDLDEQSYRIYSPDRAGPGHRRRRHSYDRERDRSYDRDRDRSRGRERSNERRHRRRDSSERKYTYDKRERDDRRDDKRRSREDLRYTSSPPRKGYYVPHPETQMRQQVHPPVGAPSAGWVPPPPPQQRMNSPPITTTPPPFNHHSQTRYPPYQTSQQPFHPTFANEPYAYPPEKLPESMLRPGAPTRRRSSSAPGNIYESTKANTSRVRIVVPGEDELTIPGETQDPPPAYEEIRGRH
ncbi:hypothetical protein BCIN_04g06030 [Botrytis cinerea B05.10]|uniref:Uncharacterized protein n=3 Tax=Botryotinia fuckeliana TaxID=40559 RepID=A0A384JGB9_BOTFB|nr:hypothetical protein BCIN_04g06030 [Botrytis cinerea B05.10]ATZ49457.1 hypothetical protein BCIN_04g06030 [Botrytis cinerea B05.10]EMR91335.1 hypothetical protein BcDW1_33 [Botrytis cinerea BcDW1]CCD45103.1 hypothetical protein BofuT4P3000016001 [Botrytis cinerea T4]